MPYKSREKLKIKADQIKFKYWIKTNIVFHSSVNRYLETGEIEEYQPRIEKIKKRLKFN